MCMERGKVGGKGRAEVQRVPAAGTTSLLGSRDLYWEVLLIPPSLWGASKSRCILSPHSQYVPILTQHGHTAQHGTGVPCLPGFSVGAWLIFPFKAPLATSTCDFALLCPSRYSEKGLHLAPRMKPG